jgi:hypothetical protein
MSCGPYCLVLEHWQPLAGIFLFWVAMTVFGWLLIRRSERQ